MGRRCAGGSDPRHVRPARVLLPHLRPHEGDGGDGGGGGGGDDDDDDDDGGGSQQQAQQAKQETEMATVMRDMGRVTVKRDDDDGTVKK